MTSKRTKDTKKLSIIFSVSSVLSYIGVALFTVISLFSKLGGTEEQGIDILSEALKARLVSVSVTIIIVTLLALIIKNKVRTMVYMLSLVVVGIIYGEGAMYAVLGVYFVDEFVFTYLHQKYKNLSIINKEIDKRA